MRRALTVLALIAVPFMHGCGGGGIVIAPEEVVESAYSDFRTSVVALMSQAAGSAGIQIDQADFIASLVPMPDGPPGVVVSTRLSGVEDLTLDDLAMGVDLMFLFLPFPIQGVQPSDVDGFYVARVFRDGDVWLFQLRTRDGQVVFTGDAQVKEMDQPSPRPIKFSLKIGAGCVTADVRAKNWEVEVKVCLELEVQARFVGLGPEGDQMLEAAQAFLAAVKEALRTVSPDSGFKDPMITGTGDFLIVHAPFEDLENSTMDELAAGRDALLLYLRGTELPAGFYKATVQKLPAAPGSEEVWQASFYEMEKLGTLGAKPNPVLTRYIEVQELAAGETTWPGLTIECPGFPPLPYPGDWCEIDWEGTILPNIKIRIVIRIEIHIYIR